MSKNTSSSRRRGFTMLELQVALVLLTMGFVTLASLLATQTRLLKRLERGFAPGATIYMTQSKDPWVKKLGAPARVTSTEIVETAPIAVTAANTVAIVEQQRDLKTESTTVTVDVTPIN